MNREQKEVVVARYEQYCHSLISLAGQVKYIEDTHGLDLSETQDTMWMFLEQMVLNKPDWLR